MVRKKGGDQAKVEGELELNAFQLQREALIRRNAQKMKAMGIASPSPMKKAPARTAGAKRKTNPSAPPARKSTRQKAEVDYNVERTFGDMDPEPARGGGGSRAERWSPDDYAPPTPSRTVTASAPVPEGKAVIPRDKNGRLKFSDHPEFQPSLTPKQMIRAGVFGGCYFNPRGGKPGIKHRGPQGIPGVGHEEYPKDWFEGLDPSMYISRRYNVPTNAYGVKAGQDQVFWEEKGWINPQDPRGWFQWYTRFYLGRRTADDERQISRWTGVAGPKGRWKKALVNKIVMQGKRFDDASVSPVIRQTLLHWAYELSERDFLTMAKS